MLTYVNYRQKKEIIFKKKIFFLAPKIVFFLFICKDQRVPFVSWVRVSEN